MSGDDDHGLEMMTDVERILDDLRQLTREEGERERRRVIEALEQLPRYAMLRRIGQFDPVLARAFNSRKVIDAEVDQWVKFADIRAAIGGPL